MRLIDADALQECCEKVKNEVTKPADIAQIIGVQAVIDGQPTIDVEKLLVCNCKGCKNNNTGDCMHCMRAYSDCYKASANVVRRG